MSMLRSALEEFRVDTNNDSAEYGRFGNGVINVINMRQLQLGFRVTF
jgi:hypothetical protein